MRVFPAQNLLYLLHKLVDVMDQESTAVFGIPSLAAWNFYGAFV
jgi:hypothetical protein